MREVVLRECGEVVPDEELVRDFAPGEQFVCEILVFRGFQGIEGERLDGAEPDGHVVARDDGLWRLACVVV